MQFNAGLCGSRGRGPAGCRGGLGPKTVLAGWRQDGRGRRVAECEPAMARMEELEIEKTKH